MDTERPTNLEGLDRFCAGVATVVASSDDEHVVTRQVAALLEQLLADGFDVPPEAAPADPEHYRMYPLYVDPEGGFSVAAAVWDVGQRTPIHGHETWGVVGIARGVEREIRYVKPTGPGPLAALPAMDWSAGQVTVCCTTDDDVHEVSCASSEPCVGIHVYGTDIGTFERRSYSRDTGDVSWFVSPWAREEADVRAQL